MVNLRFGSARAFLRHPADAGKAQAEFALVLGDASFDLPLDMHPLDDVLAVAAQEIIDRLDANPY